MIDTIFINICKICKHVIYKQHCYTHKKDFMLFQYKVFFVINNLFQTNILVILHR